jgi:hypothetical protein
VPCCSSSIFGLSRGVEKTLVLMGVWTRFTARHATRSWRIFSDCTSRGFPVLLQPSASNMALRPLSMFPYRGMMLPAMLPLNLFPGAVGSAIRAAQHSYSIVAGPAISAARHSGWLALGMARHSGWFGSSMAQHSSRLGYQFGSA